MNGQERRSRIAPESSKTKRAREKLQRQWDEQKLLITEAALADTVDKIHKWIASHAVNRVHVQKKDIRLFDQNQNAAALSRKIQHFAKKLNEDMISLKNEETLSETL
jgi:hypothetical protein